MTFGVYTSPFAGREGNNYYRQLRERLYRELETNLSLRVQDTDSRTHSWFPVGRICICQSSLRLSREGYELEVSKPEAIIKEIDGQMMEPVESLNT